MPKGIYKRIRRSEDKKICRFCKTTKGKLLKQLKQKCIGWVIQHYSCVECNRKMHEKWWKNNKKKQLEYNRKYLLKKKNEKNTSKKAK